MMITPKRDMTFLRTLSLKGPNIWTYRPVLEIWVDIGDLEDFPSNTIPGFTERLIAWLPSLIEHRCSIGTRGGFIQRLHDGTWPAHILEHVTLELQNLAGMPGGFGKAREMDQRGVYKVVVRAWHEDVTRASLHYARELILAAMDDHPFDVAATIEELRDLAEAKLLGPSTHSIVDAADDRNIPAIRLNAGNLVQLGYGAAQRRIWTAETGQTSAIAESISQDKTLTKRLLKDAGIPIPEGIDVNSAAEAWEAAEDIGLPVVVKPCSGNHGRAVFTNLTLQAEIESAYQVAYEEDSGVIVERFIQGREHRLLVIGGKLVAAARGEIASITGDGVHTISQLIAIQLNSDPRRGTTEEHPLNLIRVDSAAQIELSRQGYTADNTPATGDKVIIQRIGNVAFDCTDEVHPETAAIVGLAAKVIGLDIAGIDLVVEDISRPLAEQGGAIVEVNAGPGLLMHLKPAAGKPRPVGKAIVDQLFPSQQDGRIPVIAVAGKSDTTAVALLLAHLVCLNNEHVGLVSQAGLFLGRRKVLADNRANWHEARKLLLNPAIESAIIETPVRALLSEGLPYDRCQIAIMTGIDQTEDLSEFAIGTEEKRYNTYRTFVDVVLPSGAAILNAADAALIPMAELCDGAVIFYAEDNLCPALINHRAAQGSVITIIDGNIHLQQGDGDIDFGSVVQFSHIPTPILLASLAAAWALNIDLELIRAGLHAYP